MTLIDFLQSCVWAASLEPGQLERVAAETLDKRVPAGAFVCNKGEKVEHWIGVVEGLVKINTHSAMGKSVTFTGVPAGGWLGEGSLLKDEFRRYDVTALRDSRIAYVPRRTFNWLLDSNIGFNRFLLHQLNERLGQFIGMVECDRLHDPDARVARCLAMLYNPHLYPNLPRQLQISQEEIGFLSGVSRQRVNQALQVLQQADLVRIEYGGVAVLDLAGLAKFGE